MRVAVPESDLQRINLGQDAEILLSGEKQKLLGKPISLVPLVDPIKHTAELLYEVTSMTIEKESLAPIFAKDLMVSVLVPTGAKKSETVIPPGSILFDSFGGTWIYLEVAGTDQEHRFERRKVEVGPQVAEGQVIRPTLKAKDRVVVSGAASIFSREFHKTPAPNTTPIDDDD